MSRRPACLLVVNPEVERSGRKMQFTWAAGLNRYTDIEGKGGWGRLETLPSSGSVAEPVNPPHTLTVNTHRFRKHAAWETHYIWTLWCVAVFSSSSLSADSQHPDRVKVLLASLRVTEYIHTYHHHHLIFVISKKKKKLINNWITQKYPEVNYFENKLLRLWCSK